MRYNYDPLYKPFYCYLTRHDNKVGVNISVNGKGLNKTEIIAKYGEKFKGKKGGIGGIMLKERYIPGVFFLENGMQAATPRMKRLGESFMVQIGREIEGSGI